VLHKLITRLSGDSLVATPYSIPLFILFHNTLLVPIYDRPETFCLERFFTPFLRRPFASSVFSPYKYGDLLPRAFSPQLHFFIPLNHPYFRLSAPSHPFPITFYCCLFSPPAPTQYQHCKAETPSLYTYITTMNDSRICFARSSVRYPATLHSLRRSNANTWPAW